jgi:hypothetical protein
MVLIGISDGVVVLCVSINPDQMQLAREMYPDWILQEQIGEESVGWTFDGEEFHPPMGG